MSKALTSNVDVKKDFQSLVEQTKNQLICNMVLNNCIRLLPRSLKLSEDSFYANAIITILLTSLLYIITIFIGFVFDHSIPLLNPTVLLVSLLTILSLSIVKSLHDTILPPDPENNFAIELISSVRASDIDKLSKLSDWWSNFLSKQRQFTFAGLIGLIGIVTLYIFSKNTAVIIHHGSYFLIFLCGIAIGQGGYCAVTIPWLAKAISKVPMQTFWLRPADSLWIKEASAVFTKLSLANAFIATCIVAGLFWPKPWKTSTTTIIASVWLLITLSVVLYSFFYPQYYLAKIIKAEKRHQMLEMQKTITWQQALLNITNEEATNRLAEGNIKKLNELIKVYDELARSRESAVDMEALLRLFFSLAIPILSFVGILIQIGGTLTNYFRNASQP